MTSQITGLLIKDGSGNTTPVIITSPDDLAIAQSDGLVAVAGTTGDLAAGVYTATVTSEAGGSFILRNFTLTTAYTDT